MKLATVAMTCLIAATVGVFALGMLSYVLWLQADQLLADGAAAGTQALLAAVIGGGLALGLLGAAGAAWIGRRLRGLRAIEAAVRELSAGRLDTRIGLPRDCEIGRLAALIDDMAAQRQRYEVALSRSEENFRQIAESITEVFWVSSPDKTELFYVSPSYETIWGRDCAGLYERPLSWLDAIHPDDRDAIAEASVQQASGGYRRRYRILRPDGSLRWISDRAFPARRRDGSVSRIVGLAQDVTEQVEAELSLRERLKELGCLYQVLELTTGADRDLPGAYQQIADLLPSAWQHDSVAVARIVVGAQEYRSAGWQEPEARLTSMIDAGDGVARSLEVGYVEARPDAPAGEGPFLHEERHLLDGVATHLARMLYAHFMAESLNQAQRMDAVGQLTGGVAHDFNNLLTVILGNAELLRERLDAGSDHEDIAASIGTAAQRGAELTHQLLAFARRQPLEPRAVDVNRQLEGLDTMLRRTLGEHIDIALAQGGGIWDALVDPTQLDSALVNLALNARDAMPQGGKLTIETANVHLSNEYAAQHTDLAPGHRTRRAAAVETLPPGRAGRRRAPGSVRSLSTMTRRLLILDDDPLTGRTMQRIAEPQGLDVRCTTSAEAFFEAVHDWSPDVIILDLIMPGMDGVQVMARLAGHGCGAAIIITSGVGSRVLDAAGRAAEEHGLTITGMLPKPFLPAALRSMLAQALDTRHCSESAAGTAARAGGPAAEASAGSALTRSALELALDNRELTLVYQPKLHCQSGALAGFEALVRWQHPELGLTGPDRFVPLAEREGLMDALTRQVFEMALTWFADVCATPAEEDGLSFQTRNSISLSLNVSARSLANVALFDALEVRCRELGLAPERIILELTETSAMEDPAASLAMMTRLRVHGFHLSIDDFGTGYSSMLQLVRLPFSEIKVDKSFVITAASYQESRSVIRSVVDLGRSLGLKSTAEGVEDDATLDYLRECGCDLAQGYHIARPLPAAEVLAWARAHDSARESQRLQALRSLDVLDTPAESRFDRLTRLAQQVFRVPIALVSLVDERRQWFKSHPGMAVRETPREISFCTHAIHHDAVMVVQDTHHDPRFRDNPLVTGDPHIRFYAGCPLRLDDGSGLGTLCLIDTVPRFMGPDERALLTELAALVEKELRSGAEVVDLDTGLLGRRAFETRASDVLHLSGRLQRPATLLLVAAPALGGDPQALATFGAALRERFPEADLLGRLDDNQFAVLMCDHDGARHDTRTLLDAAIDGVAPHLGADIRTRVRAGIASAPGGRKDLQALLAEADAAMQAAPPGPGGSTSFTGV